MTKETYEKVVENLKKAQTLLLKAQEELLPEYMEGDNIAFGIFEEIRWRYNGFTDTIMTVEKIFSEGMQ